MKNSKTLERRRVLQLGLGAAGGALLSSSIAKACGLGTGEQPLGPFFPNEGTPVVPIREDDDPSVPISMANDNDLTFVKGRSGTAQGQVVTIRGQVQGQDCRPIEGAVLIIWQASESGRYNHQRDGANQDFPHPVTGETIRRRLDPHFQYWGRAISDSNGEYSFKTIVPGFYPADLQGGWYRPPHIHFMVSATGLPQFVTQSYFRGEDIIDNAFIQELNQQDFLLQSPNLSPEEREALIIDFSSGEESEGLVGKFDIQL